MKNEIFAGSIVIVVTIVLMSFNPVVGYQNMKSKQVIDSPLFSIRTNRAIMEEKKDINCDYIGKGKQSGILLPVRDRNSSQFYKAIKRISQMDDESIKHLIQHIKGVYQGRQLLDENLYRLVYKFTEKNKSSEGLIKNLIGEIDDTLIFGWTIISPMCLLIILGFILLFGVWIAVISMYMGITCDPCCFIPIPETMGI